MPTPGLPTDYVIKFDKVENPEDPRLGRVQLHDSRSLWFLQEEAPSVSDLRSIRHISHIPVLQQGDLGSCTGTSSTKLMSYWKFWNAVYLILSEIDAHKDEEYGRGVYSDATSIDPFPGFWPPTDTGSDGLSVAKVFHDRKLISGYKHATTLMAFLTALSQHPVITGTWWRRGMMHTDDDGRIFVTGDKVGGHEYVIDELVLVLDSDGNIDMDKTLIWIQNSWGPEWGIEGRGYMTLRDYDSLRRDGGDVTIFVPITEAPPVPVPPAPKPVVSSEDEKLLKAATEWLSGFPFFYRKFQKALKEWMAVKA